MKRSIYILSLIITISSCKNNNHLNTSNNFIEVHAEINESDSTVSVSSQLFPFYIRQKPTIEEIVSYGKTFYLMQNGFPNSSNSSENEDTTLSLLDKLDQGSQIKTNNSGFKLQWEMAHWAISSESKGLLLFTSVYGSYLYLPSINYDQRNNLLNRFGERWQPATPYYMFYILDENKGGVYRDGFIPTSTINLMESSENGFSSRKPYSLVCSFSGHEYIIYISEKEFLEIINTILKYNTKEQILNYAKLRPNLFEFWFSKSE